MVVHVWTEPVLLASLLLSSLIFLADLGNVSGGRSRGRLLSLSAGAGGCGVVWSLTRSLRPGGGMLGSKLGMSVGLKLRTGGGPVPPGWVSPLG